VERLVHLARGGEGQKLIDVLLELHRHGRIVLRRADVAGHDEDLVLVHQLLGGQHGLLRVIARVFDQQLDLAAVDAALLVDLVHPQLHAVARLLAVAGQRAGQILDRADTDFVLADALLGCGRAGQRPQRRGGERGGNQRLELQNGFFIVCLLLGLAVHGLDLLGVFLLDQLALEFHGRGEFLVLGAQLGFEQEELLDLLDAGELLVHVVDLALDQRLDFERARQAAVVGERHVVVLRVFLDVLLVDHDDHGQVGRLSPMTTASVT
jgi:hypothetical protein